MNSSEPAIKIENVWKVFGNNSVEALDAIQNKKISKTEALERYNSVIGVSDVSFDVKQGEIFCVMGLSGSGKSTLVRHINRLLEPTTGKILINGQDVMNLDRESLQELRNKKMLLVHNTFAEKEDITDNYYCTCPKANLYIENALPDYSIFDTDKLCVGTDSLASNDALSILEELIVIKKNSNFDMNTLLKIACKNGAEALGFEQLGTFEKGKIPGINLIQNLDKIRVIE